MIKDFVPSFYRPPSLTVVDDKILSVRQSLLKMKPARVNFDRSLNEHHSR